VIVVDASVLLDVLLQGPEAGLLEGRLFETGGILLAPHLIDLEITQVLRRHAARGQIEGARGDQALRDLADMPLERHAHDLLLPRIWSLRHNMTAYDASYVALAELYDCPLVTRDRRLASACEPGVQVEVL
jgi:predicted nucleic acid-binding protein